VSDVDRLAEQVDEAQRWLAEAGVEPPAPAPLDRVKARVRLALGERWLEEQLGAESDGATERRSDEGEDRRLRPPLGPNPDARALERVKARVREALAAERDHVPPLRARDRVPLLGEPWSYASVPGRSSAGRLYRFASTLAAAACLLLAAGLGFRSAGTSVGLAERARSSLRAVDDLAAVMQRDRGDPEVEWTALAAAVTDLENAFAGRSDDDWDETWMDALDEEIDDLTDDAGLSSDVS